MLLLYIGVSVVADLTGKDDQAAVATSTTTTEAWTRTTLPGSPIPPSPGEAYEIGGFGSPWLEGIYEAPGGPSCYWVVQRDLVGDASSIISRGGVGDRPRVGLRDGQYFTSDGCGTWVRVGRL